MEEIQLTREENVPWGIRLTGGRDFGTPLTIIKVSIGSIAEKSGLRVGDMLMKINEQPLNIYTHLDAFNFIQNAGDSFKVCLIRGATLDDIEKRDPIATPNENHLEVIQENSEVEETKEKKSDEVIENHENNEVSNSIDVNSFQETTTENCEYNQIQVSQNESQIKTNTEEKLSNHIEIIEQSFQGNSEVILDNSEKHFVNNLGLNNEEEEVNNNNIIENNIKDGNKVDSEVEQLNKINIRKTEEMLAQEKNLNKNEIKKFEKNKEKIEEENKSSIPVIDETIDDETIDVEITAFISHGAVKSLLIRNSPAPSPHPDHKENQNDSSNNQEHEENETKENKQSEPIITLEEVLGGDPGVKDEDLDKEPKDLKNLDEPIENVLFEETKEEDNAEDLNKEVEKKEENGQNLEYEGMTEEEIAEALLERAEVLKGKAIGVDFHKLPPDSDLIKESKVLQAILDEKLIKPQKKMTTFLQLPKRPKLKSPKDIKPKGTPYLPLKYKGRKALEEESEQEQKKSEQSHEEESQDINEENMLNEEENPKNLIDEVVQTEDFIEQEEEEEPEEEIDPDDVDAQIGYIQKQLQFIMELPQLIQDNLKFLQDQLVKITSFRTSLNQEPEPEPESELEKEDNPEEREGKENEDLVENNLEENEKTQEPTENGHLESEEDILENNINGDFEEIDLEEKSDDNRKKDIRWKREEEFVKNRPFFPLTPQPRPLILPGGRRWWKPKDVERYNEEFIAETLSGNEEILSGTTLGVNFNKFAKQYDYLKDSEVYQMIHGIQKENKPRKTLFERRPSKIKAIQDYPQVENCETLQE